MYAKRMGLNILDMSPLYFRGDAHIGSINTVGTSKIGRKVDCLHMCIPGPVNLFPVLLFNLLAEVWWDGGDPI